MHLLCTVVDVAFLEGQTVRLPCKTTSSHNYVQWNYQSSHAAKPVEHVYINGHVDKVYQGTFAVEYHLIIKHAAINNSGTYICMEDAGRGPESIRYHLQYSGEF